MDEAFWKTVLLGIGDDEPVDIDADLPDDARQDYPASVSHPDVSRSMASKALFPTTAAQTMAFIGVRVAKSLDNPALLANKLAAMALERRVIPIILTTLPASGLERFGLRTERLIGSEAEMAAAEAELAAFWNLSIIIDAADVERLG